MKLNLKVITAGKHKQRNLKLILFSVNSYFIYSAKLDERIMVWITSSKEEAMKMKEYIELIDMDKLDKKECYELIFRALAEAICEVDL